MQKLTIFLGSLLASCFCAKLPSSFKKCNIYQRDFNQCLRIATEDAIRQLSRPIRNIGINSLEPIEIPFLTVNSSTRSIAVETDYKNLKLFGFSNIYLLDLEMDFETNTLFIDSFFPEIKWVFDYDLDGTVLSMPIKGKGPGSIIMGNVRYTLTFTLDEYEKRGKKYFEVVRVTCGMDPGWGMCKLENLFEGDKISGDNIINAVNLNWKMLFDECRSDYEYVFGQIFSTLLNRFFANVPITEIFALELNPSYFPNISIV